MVVAGRETRLLRVIFVCPAFTLPCLPSTKRLYPLLMMAGGYRRWSIFGVAIICGFSWPNSASQENPLPLSIPVKVISGLIVMPGAVNDSVPLRVVLDTGAGNSIVSPSSAGKSGLASTHSIEAAGMGQGSSESLQMSNDCELR